MTARDCPDPRSCPVPSPSSVDLRHLRTVALETGEPFFTAFSARHWPTLFNSSGQGRSRFAPLVNSAGAVVPTLYGARTRTAALLETVFHDVHENTSRDITFLDLHHRGLAGLNVAERLVLVDLRDAELDKLGLERSQLVTSPAAHYRCTTDWAAALHGRRVGAAVTVGLLWRSRVAELARHDSPLLGDLLPGASEEVFVLFGDLLTTTEAKAYSPLVESSDLSARGSLPLVASIAEQLGATLA